MTKLVAAFHNFVNVPKKAFRLLHHTWYYTNTYILKYPSGHIGVQRQSRKPTATPKTHKQNSQETMKKIAYPIWLTDKFYTKQMKRMTQQ